MRTLSHLATSVALLTLSTTTWAGDVFVVDPFDMSAYDEISDAIAAATSSSGSADEAILVRSGTYEPFTIDGSAVDSSLLVIADTGATVVVAADGSNPAATIEDLGSNDLGVLHGIELQGSASFGALLAQNCEEGYIFCEDLVMTGGSWLADEEIVTGTESGSFGTLRAARRPLGYYSSLKASRLLERAREPLDLFRIESSERTHSYSTMTTSRLVSFWPTKACR